MALGRGVRMMQETLIVALITVLQPVQLQCLAIPHACGVMLPAAPPPTHPYTICGCPAASLSK